MYWRSRQGFMFMLALFRLVSILGLTIRFETQSHNPGGIAFTWIGIPYAIFAIILVFFVYLHSNYAQIDKPGFNALVILVDVIALNAFLFESGNHTSEIYLLLLLPLIHTSHYLSRRQSVYVSTMIVISYGFTLIWMKDIWTFKEIISANIHWTWLSRSFFLLCATWVYRIQANFPHVNETRIVSPEKARARLEEMLVAFKQSVQYDTISIQILYRDRLQIVACNGFPNQQEIYPIEFPANDPRYPNYQVIKTRKRCISDPEHFPSFKEPRYHAAHIQTWLGVPLISPTTGECFGLISIDSAKKNSYNQLDSARAAWFAMKISAFLIEAALGPASLTQATKRENLLAMLKDWAEFFRPKNTVHWDDDLHAATELAQLGTKIFHVEDCSIYFLRHKFNGDGEKMRVLHLIASTAIPREVFDQNESPVTGHHGDGLTGLAVNRNRTINFGAEQIQDSPYRSKFIGHLPYLFSKRSRQIMIVPLKDSRGKATGAIKLENRLSWPSESPFLLVEQHIFEVFASMVSLMIENIRLRNFANRQSQNVHSLRSIIHAYALSPLDGLIQLADADNAGDLDSETSVLRNIRNTVNYTKIGLDSMLVETAENLLLEKEGIVPAIYEFVESLKSMTYLNTAARRINFKVQGTREDLPLRARVGFYNIARESILNMVRHSGIENMENGYCKLAFYKSNRSFHLLIEDNGIGFDPDQKLRDSHSFGLRDMLFQREAIRKQCSHADMTVESDIKNGTRIHVWATP